MGNQSFNHLYSRMGLQGTKLQDSLGTLRPSRCNTLLLMVVSLLCTFPLHAQLRGSDWQNVSCTAPSDKIATFRSEGRADKKDQVAADAKCRLFYALFYKGVPGINDDQPLISDDDATVTAPFFNGGSAYEAYIISTDGADNARKVNGKYVAACTITVSMKVLTEYLQKHKVMTGSSVFGSGEGPLMPSIVVVPYRKTGENFKSILENDFDRRLAVSSVVDGFRSRDVVTSNIEQLVRSVQRRGEYEANSADSNDKQLLLSSDADVYVEVDLQKNSNAQGNQVSLILRAFETSTGSDLASKNAVTRRYPNAGVEYLVKMAVQSNLQAFLDDICAHWKKPSTAAGQGTRVVMQFSIDGSCTATMRDPVSAQNGMPLANLVRQWVRKNCFKAQYHMKGIVDESMIFDSVTMPPVDQDGLPMDAEQFAYLLQEFLQEKGVSTRYVTEGTTILFTILSVE